MHDDLVIASMDMAVATRGGEVADMVFHHDRGAQYLSKDFRAFCDRHHIKQSVGRIGSSQDNAVAQSFWASLKRELVSRCRFATRAEARRAIIAWINHYNALRLHSSIGNVPPIEWDADSGRFRTPVPVDSVHPFRGFRTPLREADRVRV